MEKTFAHRALDITSKATQSFSAKKNVITPPA
jgi:hypothetical protein